MLGEGREEGGGTLWVLWGSFGKLGEGGRRRHSVGTVGVLWKVREGGGRRREKKEEK
jgi:hypothetical protein